MIQEVDITIHMWKFYLIISDVHMTYITSHCTCNASQEVRFTGLKTTYYVRLYAEVLLRTLDSLQSPMRARHVSCLYASSVHTFVSMAGVTETVAVCSLTASSCTLIGNGGT
jgi:hypothetical protein